MKDYYYFIKSLFLIIATILMLMLYADYSEDRLIKKDVQEQLLPGLQSLIETLT